jgi:hypothetical protein
MNPGASATASPRTRKHDPPGRTRPRGYRRHGHSPYGLDPRDDTHAQAHPGPHQALSSQHINHREGGATSSRRGGAKRSRRSQADALEFRADVEFEGGPDGVLRECLFYLSSPVMTGRPIAELSAEWQNRLAEP